jgi:DNA topoisomerase-1
VRKHIGSTYGDDYVPEKPNAFKAKSDAQDAHEAIRPTSMEYDPDKVRPYLTPEQYSLYRLIWNRFVASQMPPATFDETTVDITAGDYLFRVKGTVPKFPGWQAAYAQVAEERPETERDKDEDDEGPASGLLPQLAEGDRLELKALRPEQKFTQPPPRFTEATLVKELEDNGIGRPSTYASIIGVLQDRDYANKIEGRFKPTALGMIITDLLIKSFDDILDVEYTRSLEEDLDRIEQGEADYKGTLTTFYKKFKKDLAKAGKEMQNLKEGIKTEEVCDRCGKGMVIKVGKFGPFVACSGYPECTNTRELEKSEPGTESEEPQEELVRQLRQADGGQARTFWASSSPAPDIRSARPRGRSSPHRADESGQARPDPRREVPEVRVEPRDQAGPLRRVHGLHELSQLQVREDEIHRRSLSQGRGRHRRAEVAARQSVLRLRQLSGLRFHAVEEADCRNVPRLRHAVPPRENYEEGRAPARLQQRKLRVSAGCAD